MAMTAEEKFPPLDEATARTMPSEMVADYNRRRAVALESQAKAAPKSTFEETREGLKAALSKLPETVVIPFELTPAGERKARFDKALAGVADEFMKPLNRNLLKNPVAFDKIATWNGAFPGPIATGPTGTRKTGAAFTALERLFVYENKAFSFFPVKRVLSEYARYEKKDILDEFYRMLGHYPVLLVDDMDKINWNFESEISTLFQFYDWVYRAQRPCITTTNHNRAWWEDRTGAAFTRRLFDEAHFEVRF